MNHSMQQFSRNERRFLMKREEQLRSNSNWGAWEFFEKPLAHRKKGWSGQCDVHKNNVFSVLKRDAGGGVVHLAVSSLSGRRPSWHEMQRIKDELAGKEATAVEVYPPHSEIVDGADMFHLWVLPEPLPFSLWMEPQS